MKEKFLFFDFDGTLANSGRVSPRVINALNKAKEKGHKIILCTGRAYGYLLPIMFEIGFDGICAGLGANVKFRGKTISLKTIGRENIYNCLSLLLENGYGGVLGGSRDRYVFGTPGNYPDPDAWALTDDMKRHSEIEEIMKIYDADPFEKISVLKPLPRDMFDKMVSEDIFGVMQPTYCEFAPKGCTKKFGIQKIIEYCGVDKADTVAFGDSNNDTDMFAAVSKRIAMGNSTKELLELADEVTESVENDGVAVWIENNLL